MTNPTHLIADFSAIDRYVIHTLGIPVGVLMENAGRQIAEAVLWQSGLGEQSARVLLLTGGGHNGGDALVAARHLARYPNLSVTVVMLDSDTRTEATQQQLDYLAHYPVTVKWLNENALWRHWLDEADMVVDGVFGTGLSRAISGLWAEVIDYANQSRPKRQWHGSVDIPSGIVAATGAIAGGSGGTAFLADDTITFEVAKPGHYLEEGKAGSGRVSVVPIAMPPDVISQAPSTISVARPAHVLATVPALPAMAHKYTRGLVGVVCAPNNMLGAPQLVCQAAMRSGAGMVSVVGVPHWLSTVTGSDALPIETVAVTVETPALLTDAINQKPYQTLLAGPGWGTSDDAMGWLRAVVVCATEKTLPLVLDADALNLLALARKAGAPIALPAHTVLTPHVGEAARLLETDSATIRHDMVRAGRQLQTLFGVQAVVLKSASTVVVDNEQSVSIVQAGNAGLATAGSGDVLAGVIAGLCAQQYPLPLASLAGACWHGATGDYLAAQGHAVGITASQLATSLPAALSQLRG